MPHSQQVAKVVTWSLGSAADWKAECSRCVPSTIRMRLFHLLPLLGQGISNFPE